MSQSGLERCSAIKSREYDTVMYEAQELLNIFGSFRVRVGIKTSKSTFISILHERGDQTPLNPSVGMVLRISQDITGTEAL